MKKEISKLTIKAFGINNVVLSNRTYIDNDNLYLEENIEDCLRGNYKLYIKEVRIRVIKKEDRNIFVNSIMDFIPISTKVLGKLGEGITHTLLGVCVMLTGVDEKGVQIAEFGSSEGILKEKVCFGMAGTPNEDDIIININVTVHEGLGTNRNAITCCHEVCDNIIQNIREKLKKLNGRLCDEKKEYVHCYDSEKTNIAIVKQVAGQGAMYDTHILPNEPSGVKGSYSIIDVKNMPVILTPNEYRDGAIRAMY